MSRFGVTREATLTNSDLLQRLRAAAASPSNKFRYADAYVTPTGSIVLSTHGVCRDEFPAADKDDVYSRCVVRRRMRVIRKPSTHPKS